MPLHVKIPFILSSGTQLSPLDHRGLGIRTAKLANIVMLGKDVWSISRNENKLWVDIFKNCYFENAHIFTGIDDQSRP